MPDNRELALLVTVAVLALLVLVNGSTRKPFLRLLSCLFWSRLTIAGLAGAIWLAAAISVLRWLGMWDQSNLKDTVLWFATGGCLLIFQGMQATNPNAEFKSVISEQFKFVLFFELVVNAYPFSLVGELALLMGTAFLAGVISVVDLDPAHASVGKIAKFLLGLVVVFVVCFSFYRLFSEPKAVFCADGLRVFGLPIYFALILLPFGYLLTVYAAYETLFVTKVAKHAMMPPALRSYAKWRLFVICKLNANAVRRAQSFLPAEFRWSESRDVIDAELLRLREQLAWKQPPPAEA